MASTIKEYYDEFDAFIIIHGTDTMSFSASALSFMLENLSKTVIITGSQIPMEEVRNDGNGNLLGSLVIATHYRIPEVCIYFNNQLFRGNRTTKFDASGFGAFVSSNYQELGNLGIEASINWEAILPNPEEKFKVYNILEKNVACLQLYPGIPDDVLKSFLGGTIVGIVLETYGSGNAPNNRKNFLDMLKKATDDGVIIVNITQCKKGSVQMSYATGNALFEAGVIPGGDMTTEAALTKIMFVLSLGLTNKESRELIKKNLRGELTEIREQKFSLKEKLFVSSVAQFITKNPTKDDYKEIRTVLYPVMVCALASQGSLDEIKSLMSKDRNCIHLLDYDQRSPLHLAATEGQLKVIQFLHENGCDLSVVDRFGFTPLRSAIESGHFECAKFLSEHKGKIGMDQTKIGERLCSLASRGKLKKIQGFIEYGRVDINACDYDQRTALHLASSEGQLEIVKYLISKGADKTLKDRFGYDAKDCAKMYQKSDIYNYLESFQEPVLN